MFSYHVEDLKNSICSVFPDESGMLNLNEMLEASIPPSLANLDFATDAPTSNKRSIVKFSNDHIITSRIKENTDKHGPSGSIIIPSNNIKTERNSEVWQKGFTPLQQIKTERGDVHNFKAEFSDSTFLGAGRVNSGNSILAVKREPQSAGGGILARGNPSIIKIPRINVTRSNTSSISNINKYEENQQPRQRAIVIPRTVPYSVSNGMKITQVNSNSGLRVSPVSNNSLKVTTLNASNTFKVTPVTANRSVKLGNAHLNNIRSCVPVMSTSTTTSAQVLNTNNIISSVTNHRKPIAAVQPVQLNISKKISTTDGRIMIQQIKPTSNCQISQNQKSITIPSGQAKENQNSTIITNYPRITTAVSSPYNRNTAIGAMREHTTAGGRKPAYSVGVLKLVRRDHNVVSQLEKLEKIATSSPLKLNADVNQTKISDSVVPSQIFPELSPIRMKLEVEDPAWENSTCQDILNQYASLHDIPVSDSFLNDFGSEDVVIPSNPFDFEL